MEWRKNRYILYIIFNILTPFDHKNILGVCSEWRTILLNFLQTKPKYLDFLFNTKLNVLSFTTRNKDIVEKFDHSYDMFRKHTYTDILSPINWSYYQNIPTLNWVCSNFSYYFNDIRYAIHNVSRESLSSQDFLYLFNESTTGSRINKMISKCIDRNVKKISKDELEEDNVSSEYEGDISTECDVEILKLIDIQKNSDSTPCIHCGNGGDITTVTLVGSNMKKYTYRCEDGGLTYSDVDDIQENSSETIEFISDDEFFADIFITN